MYNEYLPVKTWYFQTDPLPWFRAKSHDGPVTGRPGGGIPIR
jgi:hypothetical protein